MEHISYDIIKELLKNNLHIRALAKKLNTNHMNIVRKMNELYNQNIVDYKKEGKNKTYFIKPTLEAKEYLYMAEHHKLLQLLKKYPELRKTIETIKNNKSINLAVLFGSYAKGTANKDSDIDIYIETENKNIKQELEALDSKLSIKTGRYEKQNLLIKEIEKNNIIIKGVEKYYERFFE